MRIPPLFQRLSPFYGPDYGVAVQALLRGGGVIFLFSFWSLASQAAALWGPRGLTPVPGFVLVMAALGLGTLGSLLLICGRLPWWGALLAWTSQVFLLSQAGGWMSLPGDFLLAETGFLLLFVAKPGWSKLPPPSRMEPRTLGILLCNLLLVRVLLGSGLTKLLGGDPFWPRETALNVFFETQVLPSVPAWYFHHLPGTLLKYGVWAVMFIELVFPFYVLMPRLFRAMAAGGTAALMLLLIVTGNHGPAPWLVILLCAALVDDRFWREKLPEGRGPGANQAAPRRSMGAAAWTFLAFWLPVSLGTIWFRSPDAFPPPWRQVARTFRQSAALQPYVFGTPVRPQRFEIEIQGSLNGQEWREYLFKVKPGHPQRLIRFAGLHVPRLDARFAELAPFFGRPELINEHPWLEPLLGGLVANDPVVLSLLAANPFPDQPPAHLRLVLYQVRYADPVTRRERGIWWLRAPRGSMHGISVDR